GWRTGPEDGGPATYEQFVGEVVGRYARSPAVAVWEPVNEPEASDCAPGYTKSACLGHLTCAAGAAAALQQFFDGVGATIKAIDPQRLVSTGSIGGDQCGWAGHSWLAHASPVIHLLRVHQYHHEDATPPAV